MGKLSERGLRWMDAVIVLAGAAAVAWAVVAARAPSGGTRRLVIRGGEKEYVYPLDRDGEWLIEGPLGMSRIVAEGGQARFADSPCPNKTCVQQGAIGAGGEWAACLPNDVFISIEGGTGLDATAR